MNDMLISVICSGFRRTLNRRRAEARLILQHKTLHPSGVNIDHGLLACVAGGISRASVFSAAACFCLGAKPRGEWWGVKLGMSLAAPLLAHAGEKIHSCPLIPPATQAMDYNPCIDFAFV